MTASLCPTCRANWFPPIAAAACSRATRTAAREYRTATIATTADATAASPEMSATESIQPSDPLGDFARRQMQVSQSQPVLPTRLYGHRAGPHVALFTDDMPACYTALGFRPTAPRHEPGPSRLAQSH